MDAKREKKCNHCGEIFKPFKTTDKYCSFLCAKLDGAIKPINKVSEKRQKINILCHTFLLNNKS